jgi:hypothetical protein
MILTDGTAEVRAENILKELQQHDILPRPG